jgi:hypothetical protein
MGLIGQAIFFSVLSALLICAVIVLLFAAELTGARFANGVALLFIGSMISIGGGFGFFLIETRIGSRSVRVRSQILEHEAEPEDDESPPV